MLPERLAVRTRRQIHSLGPIVDEGIDKSQEAPSAHTGGSALEMPRAQLSDASTPRRAPGLTERLARPACLPYATTQRPLRSSSFAVAAPSSCPPCVDMCGEETGATLCLPAR